jgi:hypothetical protein
MGGGASKANASTTTPVKDINPQEDTQPDQSITKTHKPPTVFGPKNGELAPLTGLSNTRASWNDQAPLQPIVSRNPPRLSVESTPIVPISMIPAPLDRSSTTQVPAKQTNTTTITTNALTLAPPSCSPSPTPSLTPTKSSSPPLQADISPDPFKNKPQFLERKFSTGINSPITRYKNILATSLDKLSAHDEDQVVVDGSDDEEEDDLDDPPHMDHQEKSHADKYYETFAEKTKPNNPHNARVPQNGSNLNGSNQNNGSNNNNNNNNNNYNPIAIGATSPSVSFSLEEEDSALYTEYGDYKNSNILSNSKKLVSVPALKLGEIGM